MWVILRRFIPNACELSGANAHNWHPDFILKLRITFHPQLALALGPQVFLLALQHRDPPISSRQRVRPDSAVRIGQAVARTMTSGFQLVSKQNYLGRIGCQGNIETLL